MKIHYGAVIVEDGSPTQATQDIVRELTQATSIAVRPNGYVLVEKTTLPAYLTSLGDHGWELMTATPMGSGTLLIFKKLIQ